MPEIVSEKIVLDDKLVVEKAQLKEGESTFERLRLVRQDASVVLLYNPETDNVILTKQYRYPVAKSTSENILEAVAGKVDEGETPLEAALRETEEEAGYKIAPANLHFLTACFAAPGYSTEQYFVYWAEVTDQDRISQGGGLAAENEQITLVELKRETFLAAIRSGEIRDAKTCLAGLLADFSANT